MGQVISVGSHGAVALAVQDMTAWTTPVYSGVQMAEAKGMTKWTFSVTGVADGNGAQPADFSVYFYGTLDPLAKNKYTLLAETSANFAGPSLPPLSSTNNSWFLLPALDVESTAGTETNPIVDVGITTSYSGPLVAVCVVISSSGVGPTGIITAQGFATQ